MNSFWVMNPNVLFTWTPNKWSGWYVYLYTHLIGVDIFLLFFFYMRTLHEYSFPVFTYYSPTSLICFKEQTEFWSISGPNWETMNTWTCTVLYLSSIKINPFQRPKQQVCGSEYEVRTDGALFCSTAQTMSGRRIFLKHYSYVWHFILKWQQYMMTYDARSMRYTSLHSLYVIAHAQYLPVLILGPIECLHVLLIVLEKE